MHDSVKITSPVVESPSVDQQNPFLASSDSQSKANVLRRSFHGHVPKPPFTSVKDIGFSEELNPRHRRTMEDGHCIIDGFGNDKTCGYYAIYDGHGGRQAVDHVQETLHERLLDELSKPQSVRDAFTMAYKRVDNELKEKEIMYNGTTAISCLIRVEDGVRKLYAANAGDARIVLCRGGKPLRLTYDHKASDEREVKRIQDTGGFVAYNRVNGILSVTRALGDHAMKDWVLGDPDHQEVTLTEEDKLVILACDGLWDVFSDKDAVEFALNFPDAQQGSQKLLEKALEKGSTDNISVMVLYL